MRKPDTSPYKTFDQITTRLDEIIIQVRDKDTSLERSLDLFDEAIALGSKAVDLVDTTEFSPEEEALLNAAAATGAEISDAAPAQDAPQEA
jgi:exonuclease VII small subunit